jgi:nucleotide-binding universal stress UspA family protein
MHAVLAEMAMSDTTILLFGALALGLAALFVSVYVWQLKRSGMPVAAATPHAPPARHPLRVLVATDGSASSDCAIASVASRPWPPRTEIEIATVVHTNLPLVPDVFLGGAAAHVTKLEEDRSQAPARVQLAERQLAGVPGVSVTSRILEGEPARVLLDEAKSWNADLIVVGSHGRGPAGRLLLGSVSQNLAQHATCSVEIVRCR